MFTGGAFGHSGGSDPADVEGCTLADLVSLWSEIDRLQARAALMAAWLDAERAWALDGAASMAAWMRSHLRVAHGQAKAVLRIGRRLADLPVTRDAALTGRLSLAQVRAITGMLTDRTAVVFAAQEADLVPAFAELDVRRTEQACATWRAYAAALDDAAPAPERDHGLQLVRASDGALLGDFVLDPGRAVHVETAIATATRFDGPEDTRTPAQRRADALVEVCCFFNANHTRSRGARNRPHIEIVVDAGDLTAVEPLAHTSAGHVVPAHAFDTLACDSALHRVLVAPDARVSYGTEVRTAPTETFRVVALRDGGCRFPGCDRPAAWCDAHHVRHWRHGGTTDPDNLVLLCSRHHHDVHRYAHELSLLPDGRLRVAERTGRVRITDPNPPGRARDLVRRE